MIDRALWVLARPFEGWVTALQYSDRDKQRLRGLSAAAQVDALSNTHAWRTRTRRRRLKLGDIVVLQSIPANAWMLYWFIISENIWAETQEPLNHCSAVSFSVNYDPVSKPRWCWTQLEMVGSKINQRNFFFTVLSFDEGRTAERCQKDLSTAGLKGENWGTNVWNVWKIKTSSLSNGHRFLIFVFYRTSSLTDQSLRGPVDRLNIISVILCLCWLFHIKGWVTSPFKGQQLVFHL